MKTVRVVSLIVFALALVVFLGVGFGLGWSVLLGPKTRQVTDRTFEATPERLERGKYLVDGVCACMKCHSTPDLDRHGAPPKEGTYGAGAVHRGPGVVVAPNITPDPETGTGSWTDDELARAIREGVSRDGRTLFPMMPYHKYRYMSDEDIASVVVYLRTIEPVRIELPATEIIFPVKHLINNYPQPVTSPVKPPLSTQVERGRYLVTIAACADCHTTFDSKREPIAGLDFAGGNTMEENEGTATVANITPDASGIGGYTAERFREVMKTGRDGGRELHPLMPYSNYQHLTGEDLDAIYAYLQTVKPIKHWVSNSGSKVYCSVCNYEHGMGELNASN